MRDGRRQPAAHHHNLTNSTAADSCSLDFGANARVVLLVDLAAMGAGLVVMVALYGRVLPRR